MNKTFDPFFKEMISFPTICIYNLCIFALMMSQFKKYFLLILNNGENMKIIVANWKMNGTVDYINDYFDKFLSNVKIVNSEVIFAVPYVFLEHIKKIVKNQNIKIFAQNCSHEENGAFTGEISASMLSSMGVDGSIVGHCERRKYGENYEIINKKIKILTKHNLRSIICIGEDDKEHKEEILEEQLEKCLYGIENYKNMILAYEPVWSIGKNHNLDLEEIDNSIAIIRGIVKKLEFEELKILYGGSVNKNNVREISAKLNINGVLIGRDSLDPMNFSQIVNFLE